MAEIEKERVAAGKDGHDDEYVKGRISREPRYEYFIYVDEALMESVIGEGRTGR